MELEGKILMNIAETIFEGFIRMFGASEEEMAKWELEKSQEEARIVDEVNKRRLQSLGGYILNDRSLYMNITCTKIHITKGCLSDYYEGCLLERCTITGQLGAHNNNLYQCTVNGELTTTNWL